MVLDPMTGEMIPDPDAGNEEEWDEEANLSEIQPVTIKLGQLNKSKHGSTQVCVLIFAVDHSGFKVHFFISLHKSVIFSTFKMLISLNGQKDKIHCQHNS